MLVKGTSHLPFSQRKTNVEAPDVSKIPCCFSWMAVTVPPRYMAFLPSTAAVKGTADTNQQPRSRHNALFIATPLMGFRGYRLMADKYNERKLKVGSRFGPPLRTPLFRPERTRNARCDISKKPMKNATHGF